MRWLRYVEIPVVGSFAAFGLFALVGGRVPAALALLAFAALALFLFEWRHRGHLRNVARVRARMDAAAARLDGGRVVLDAPTRPELLASSPTLARMMAGRATRTRVEGTWRGHAVELDSVVLAGRDFDSYVTSACVLDPGRAGTLRAMTRSAVTGFVRLGGHAPEHTTGDAAFDAAYVVDGDAELVPRVLDSDVRARLLALLPQKPAFTAGSLELTPVGVVVRWPADVDPVPLADLALEAHARLPR